MASQRKVTRAKKESQGVPVRTKEVRTDSYGLNSFKLTESQKELANKIFENDLVLCDSPAGTGKSATVLHTFARLYLQDPSKQIVVVRTPVEAGGDKVGFLPLDLAAKTEPHFASTKLLLTKMLNKGKVETDMDHRIHFKIPNFMLGSTFDNTLLLIDESQEISPLIMKLILERVGVNSKCVVAGDASQRYATEQTRGGLSDVIKRFTNKNGEPKFDSVAFHKFTIDDVQRSDFCKMVLRAYS